MSRADNGAQELGISGTILMERAGAAMAQVILESYAPLRALVVCGGGNNGEGMDVHAPGQQRKPLQRRQRAGLAFGVQPTGFRKALAQAAHDLFVVEIGRAAGGAIEDHHPDRVRADVDDTDPPGHADALHCQFRRCGQAHPSPFTLRAGAPAAVHRSASPAPGPTGSDWS